jgi:hypothetical protein
MALLLFAGIMLVFFGIRCLQLAYEGNSDAGLASAAFFAFGLVAFAVAFLAGENDVMEDGKGTGTGYRIDPIWPWPERSGNSDDSDNDLDVDSDTDTDIDID